MAIYSRFGSEVKLVRPCTKADIKKHEGRKWDKEDDRLAALDEEIGGMLWTIEWADRGGEATCNLAHLVADDGWKEIRESALTTRQGVGAP